LQLFKKRRSQEDIVQNAVLKIRGNSVMLGINKDIYVRVAGDSF